MSVIKFNRNFSTLFSWDTDDNPTTEQDYQNAVKNWTETEMNIVDTLLWQPTTEYATGNIVKTPSLPSQYVLRCAEAGTSGSTEPSYSGASVGDSVTDGTVEWVIVSLATGNVADVDASNIGVNAEVDNSEAWASAIGGGAIAEDDGRLVTGDTVHAVTSELASDIATNTEAIEDNAEAIATNTENIAQNTTDIDIAEKRIGNIEKLLQGNLYDYQTDTDSKYTKTVLAGAMPYASLDSVGGKTLVMNQLVQDPNMTDATKWSTDTIPANFSFSVSSNTLKVERLAGTNNFVLVSKPNTTKRTANHKFLYSFTLRGDVARSIRFYYGSGTDTINATTTFEHYSGICTPTTGGGDIGISVLASQMDVGGYIEVQNYCIFDLTLMYGAGNEPTTVAEFTAQFPAQYYPYNAGTLLSAGVTEVVSVGKNRINIGMPYYSGNGLYNQGVGVHFASGLNPNVNIQKVNDSEYTMSVASSWSGILLVVPLKSGESVHLSGTISSSVTNTIRGTQYYLDAQHNVIQVIANISSSTDTVTHDVTRTAPSNCAYFATSYLVTNASSVVTFHNMQIDYGTTATTYSPYKENTYPIPAEIQALEGYGWSAGQVYNYIDYERKVFVKRVGSVTLDGTENWISAGGNAPYIYVPNNGKDYTTNATPNILTVDYTAVPWNASFTDYDKMVAYYSSSWRFRDTSCADLSAWTTKLSVNPLTVYYELATPIEVDISAYLTDDNLISVESGGTLTFPNSNGTDYQIPVPSAETYMVDLQEAI